MADEFQSIDGAWGKVSLNRADDDLVIAIHNRNPSIETMKLSREQAERLRDRLNVFLVALEDQGAE